MIGTGIGGRTGGYECGCVIGTSDDVSDALDRMCSGIRTVEGLKEEGQLGKGGMRCWDDETMATYREEIRDPDA